MGAGPQAGGPSPGCGGALGKGPGPGHHQQLPWQAGYRQVVERGLELVESGSLRKLVLAVRQHLELDQPLDPLRLLAHLRQRQPGSCRFLWQQGEGAALLGASPERLLAVRQGRLRSDALAGTAPIGPLAELLTSSGKDRHEHELVVEAITQALWKAGLTPTGPAIPAWPDTASSSISTPPSPPPWGTSSPWPWRRHSIPHRRWPACRGARRWPG